jgi:hypothetical protein
MTSAFPHRYGHEVLRRRPTLDGLVEAGARRHGRVALAPGSRLGVALGGGA